MPTPTHNPTSDEKRLLSLLGPMAPDCQEVRPDDPACRRLFASAAKSVQNVQVALEGMPQTAAYLKVSQAVDSFRESYKEFKDSGCYKRGGRGSLATCTGAWFGPSLDWVNLKETIGRLAQPG